MLWSLPAAFGNTYFTPRAPLQELTTGYAELFVPDYDHGRKGPL